MLFISSILPEKASTYIVNVEFQSRNRDAFHFKKCRRIRDNPKKHAFQSRNRDAFHFKIHRGHCSNLAMHSFNLVIEMLFISSILKSAEEFNTASFQSRNRDAFHFKVKTKNEATLLLNGFNLVIEMLFISRASDLNSYWTCLYAVRFRERSVRHKQKGA